MIFSTFLGEAVLPTLIRMKLSRSQSNQQVRNTTHGRVCTETHQRDKLERLCRYITCPAVSEQRSAFTPGENIRMAPRMSS